MVPYVQKPAFEQFRHEVITRGKPMLEKNVVPIQAAVVERLERFEGLLVEKVRRVPHDMGMLEVSAKWLGLGEDQSDVVRLMRKGFPEGALHAETANFWVGPSDEAILLLFAAKFPEDRFLTGRVLITF